MVVRRGFVAIILLALKEITAAGRRVMKISQALFRQTWTSTCRRLGLAFLGPPNNIRHSGPSEDLQRGLISLEGARRTGRPKILESVQRYTKTFQLTRCRAQVAPLTMQKAKAVAKDIVKALKQALTLQRDSSVAQQVLKALNKSSMPDQMLEFKPKVETSRKREKKKDEQDEAGAMTDCTDGWATD